MPRISLALVPSLVSAGLSAGDQTNTKPLTATGCFAPKVNGGWGYCGPAFCQNQYTTCEGPATVNGVTGTYDSRVSANTCSAFIAAPRTDNTKWEIKGPCSSSCTQQKTGMCSTTFLESIIKGTGLKYAYCNDKWLVLKSSGAPGVFTANLNDIPAPPKGTGGVTGMATLSLGNDEAFIPLSTGLLSTAHKDNNKAVFNGPGDGANLYLSNDVVSFGLPSAAGVGIGVNGQSIFPIYNNRAVYNQIGCELDSCQEHVGQGGGQPHFHGDPYGDQNTTTCMYGPSDYKSATGVQSNKEHPPIIGFSYDGLLIYGRYLDEAAPGYSAPALDACGGHMHTEELVDRYGINLKTTYHYHTQIFDHTSNGEAYTVSSTGPFQCWKADLTKSEGSSALLTTGSSGYKGKNDMAYTCCDMTEGYKSSGVSWPSDVMAGVPDNDAPGVVPTAFSAALISTPPASLLMLSLFMAVAAGP